MKINIFKWCDEKLSYLKSSGIKIDNDVAVMPISMIYIDKISYIVPYKYRGDIPIEQRKKSILCNFISDHELFIRLIKIDNDIEEIKKYGGISGFDLSPGIGMLRPRQRFNILINSIYNCYLGLHGIKILPNSRVGDIKTMHMINSFPDNVNLITGMHGCKKYGLKAYGLYQLKLIIKEKRPPILYVYGSLSLREAKKLFWCDKFKIITFPDRRNFIRNSAMSYVIYYDGKSIVKILNKNAYIGVLYNGS